MKTTATILIILAAILAGCSSLRSVSDSDRGEISWALFCEARGYDPVSDTPLQYNEYLDSWCGSAEEEQAFINAGIRPY